MAVYSPLFVYLTPASIPQVVAHIQKYLADNPIVSDPEAIAEVIQQYIEDHPEIIAVASVNGKTGNVVLTGSDININASSAVSVETQLLNLASMISTAGANISQINAQLETIYTNIGTIETNVSNNTTAIGSLQTSVAGQGTRLATAESDIDALESAQTAQGTRLNTAEGNISSLQTRMSQAESDIDSNESNIETLNTNVGTLQNDMNNLKNKSIISVYQQETEAPTLVANQYVKGCSLTLGPGVYVILGECTFQDSGTTTRTIALRIGYNSNEGPFLYVPSASHEWQHREVARIVEVQSTSEISLYMYASYTSSGRCANTLIAIKIN